MTEEEKREYQREWWRKKHEDPEYHEKYRKKRRKWRIENNEKIKESDYKYLHTENGRARQMCSRYKWKDKKKGYDVSGNITHEWIIEHVFHSQCYYCGETDWLKLGTDRIDNDKPHTPENCICSCWKCNNERNANYTVEEFKRIKDLEKAEKIPTFVTETQGAVSNCLSFNASGLEFDFRFPLQTPETTSETSP